MRTILWAMWSGAAVVLIAPGCTRSPAPATVTVEYFRAHADARAAALQACANNPGDLREDPTCINARQAARIEDAGSLRALPSLGLPGPAAERPAPPPGPKR